MAPAKKNQLSTENALASVQVYATTVPSILSKRYPIKHAQCFDQTEIDNNIRHLGC